VIFYKSDFQRNFPRKILKNEIKTKSQPVKGEPYFPFLNHLSLPEGDPEKIIQPKIYGYTYCCQNCFNVLFKQYLIYEKERFPQGTVPSTIFTL